MTNIAIIHDAIEENNCDDIYHIEQALACLGHAVTKIQTGDCVETVLLNLKKLSPDYVFNLCEGFRGISWGEVYIAGLMELMGLTYTGSGPMALAVSLDKARSKDILRAHGLPVPLYRVFGLNGRISISGMKLPLIVKPLYEDGSFGIDNDSVVRDRKSLCLKVQSVWKSFTQPAIAEEYIEGREFNVAVLGQRVLPISEIDFSTMPSSRAMICSYDSKWNRESEEYKGTVPVCPAKLSSKQKKLIEKIVIKTYEIIGCRDYARIDIRLDKAGNPHIIDVNPNPCLNPDSGFVRSASAAGLGYKEFVKIILDECAARKKRFADNRVFAAR